MAAFPVISLSDVAVFNNPVLQAPNRKNGYTKPEFETTILININTLTLLKIILSTTDILLQLILLTVFGVQIFNVVFGFRIYTMLFISLILLWQYLGLNNDLHFKLWKSYLTAFLNIVIIILTFQNILEDIIIDGFIDHLELSNFSKYTILSIWILVFLLNVYICLVCIFITIHQLGLILQGYFNSSKRSQEHTEDQLKPQLLSSRA